MNLKLAILSFCAVATAARGHRIRANLDYHHQFQFRATENALRRLLLESEESNRSNKDAETLHVLRGSGRDLKDIECTAGTNKWYCKEDTEECGGTVNVCNVVCDETTNCNDHGKCKKGKCDCRHNFKGASCDKCERGYYDYKDDCKYYDVDLEYRFNFIVHIPEEDENEEVSSQCLETINSLQAEVDEITDELPNEATLKVSGSGKGKHRKSALVLAVDVVVDDCTQGMLLDGARLSIEDISLPSGATFKTGGSRD